MRRVPTFSVRNPFDVVDSSDDIRLAGKTGPLILVAAAVRFLMYVGGAYVLTILIAPGEFGRLLQIGVPFALVSLLGDLGLGDGVVRLKRLDARLSSSFWYLNLAFSGCVAIVFIGIIPVFEAWFDGVALMDLGLVMSATIVVGGANAQYRALMRRQLRFKAIAGLEVVGSVLGNSVPIVLALSGFGVIAIPIGRLVASVVDFFLMVFATGWIPGRASGFSEARKTLSFGLKLAASGVFHFGAASISAMMIGRIFPEDTLGFLERSSALSKGIVDRLMAMVSRLSFPVLARSRHGEAGRFEFITRAGIGLLCRTTIMPITVVAILSDALAPLLLGEDWLGLGTYLLLQWLSLILAFVGIFVASAVLAVGRSGLLLKANIVRFVIELVVMGIAIIWLEDLYVFLSAQAVIGVLYGLLSFEVFGRAMGLQSWEVVRPVIANLLTAFAVGLLLLLALSFSGVVVASSIGGIAIIWCLGFPIWHYRSFISDIWSPGDKPIEPNSDTR